MVKSFGYNLGWRALASGLFFGLLSFAPAALGAIQLNKLTACDDMATLYQTLKSGHIGRLEECSHPQNRLEEVLIQRLGQGAKNICFLRSSFVQTLAGFACASAVPEIGGEIFCFRAADIEDIRQYKKTFDSSFASLTKAYEDNAAKCAVSNGDVTDAQWTLFPNPLFYIAKFEFGFVSGLGTQRPVNGRILHAYASIDPSVAGDVPQAIEVVDMIEGVPLGMTQSDTTTRQGDWILHTDEGGDFSSTFNRMMRRSGFPVYLEMRGYRFEKSTVEPLAASAREEIPLAMSRAIASTLEEEGFRQWSDLDLRAATGMNSEEFLEKMYSSQPYGARQIQSELESTPTFFANEKRPSCARNGSGALFVMTMASKPAQAVFSDYGSITIFFEAAGSCARESLDISKDFIENLISSTEPNLNDAH